MADLSTVTNFLMANAVKPLIWLIILIGSLAVIFGFLIIRKKRRAQWECVEIVDLGGNGKTCLNTLKCGWFGIKIYAKGLFWSGREVMRTNSMEIIHSFSEEDFQEVNGKRGVVIYRDPITKMLFPISKLRVHNKELLADIPPADFIDTAIDIIKDATKETSDFRDKLLQFAGWALVVVFSLIAIIFIVRMVQQGQKDAGDLIIKAGETCLSNAKEVCTQVCSNVKSTTAP